MKDIRPLLEYMKHYSKDLNFRLREEMGIIDMLEDIKNVVNDLSVRIERLESMSPIERKKP